MKSLTPRRFFSFAMASIALMTLSTSAWAQERVNARVTGELYVRTGPGSGYRVLGALPDGTKVDVRSQSGSWSEIALGTGTAWVPTVFLGPLAVPPPSATIPNPGAATIPNAGAGAVRVGALLVRIALSTPTAGTTPPTAGTPPAASVLTSLVNGLRTQSPTNVVTDAAPTGSIGAPPVSAPSGSTSIGTTSIGAPTTTPSAAPSTTPAPTPAPTPTPTAPSAPASNAALPTSSAYAPTGSVPVGQSGGYIQLRASGAGHYGYGSAARKYGRPALIYGLERISAQFASTGHKMGVGDISQNGGGRISGHASHTLGVDVDVRPCRKDKAQLPVTWQQTAVYDRAATQTLGNLFGKELKLTLFFYNDPQVSVRTKTNWPNHDNHFHARINPN